MLVSFKVGNYLSFKNEVEFSLKTLANRELWRTSTFSTSITDVHLNKTAALYGANSSGKSNLIKALRFFIRFIRNSAKETQAEEEIDVTPFKLSTSGDSMPCAFEIQLIVGGLMYRYGFKVDKERVHKEWLYRTKKIKESFLFERNFQSILVDEKLSNAQGLETKTRQNALFLSVCAQWNVEIAVNIIEAMKKIIFLRDYDPENLYTSKLLEDTRYRKAILNFLGSADLGFSDIKTENFNVDENLRTISNRVKEILSLGKISSVIVKTIHPKLDENNKIVGQVILDMSKEESDGTQKMFALAGFIVDALFNGKVLVIDEFTSKLHPLLARHVIEQFNSSDANSSNAQFIFVSHNTFLMDEDLLRRDQIFLIRKNNQYATEITTLFEEGVRSDSAYQKKYFSEGFGAVPKLKKPNLNSGDQLNLFQEHNSDE